MTIIEDTGQKIGQHDNIAEWCHKNGITVRRQKLNVGDYALPPRISIDTKKGMLEVYSNIVSDHARFREECLRAQEDNIKLVILIEDEQIRSLEDAKTWRNPMFDKYQQKWGLIIRAQKSGKMLNKQVPKPPVESERLVGMMTAMTMKYGVEWAFCHPNDTGKKIVEILLLGVN